MINGSHLETMKELLLIYEEQDDRANIKKYSEKIKMIEAAQEEDQAQLVENTQKENKRLEEEEPEPIPEESRESFDTSELDEFEPESALAAADEETADDSAEPAPEETTAEAADEAKTEATEVVKEEESVKGFRRAVRRKKQ